MCAEAFPVSTGKLILLILPWPKITWNEELMNIAVCFIKNFRHFALFPVTFICSFPLALCSWGNWFYTLFQWIWNGPKSMENPGVRGKKILKMSFFIHPLFTIMYFYFFCFNSSKVLLSGWSLWVPSHPGISGNFSGMRASTWISSS